MKSLEVTKQDYPAAAENKQGDIEVSVRLDYQPLFGKKARNLDWTQESGR